MIAIISENPVYYNIGQFVSIGTLAAQINQALESCAGLS